MGRPTNDLGLDEPIIGEDVQMAEGCKWPDVFKVKPTWVDEIMIRQLAESAANRKASAGRSRMIICPQPD